MLSTLQFPGLRFRTREAKGEGVCRMTDVFFRSFNAPFLQYFIPDTAGVPSEVG